MTKQDSTAELRNAGSERLDDTLIAEYLQENPDFFDRNPELLTRINLQHHNEGSVSLVERQQRILRSQIAELQEEITELMSNARRNEMIFRGYSALYVDLLRCETLTEVLDSLRTTFQQQLALPELTLKFFDSPVSLPDQFTFAADTHKQLLSKRFGDSSVYLGRLTQEEQRLLFQDTKVESVALVLLGRDQQLGMLAFGSKDPSHFDPSMDYLLINQLQALLSVILPIMLKSGT